MTGSLLNVYQVLFDLLLRRLDPEQAHLMAHKLIEWAGRIAPARAALNLAVRWAAGGGGRPTYLLGRTLPGPLGLAAGFDKDARAVLGLTALGFSFVEVGTITRYPQAGNTPPRLWRYVDQRALRNAMGFNNAGASQAERTLRRLRAAPGGWNYMVGVNIGKSKVTPTADAAADYFASAARLARYADYLVVNVSSPNTPGLRDLQAANALRGVAEAARDGAARSLAGTGRRAPVPVLVKLAPDLPDEGVDDAARLVLELGLAGAVAVNTTINHDLGPGGLSGPVLRERGLAVVGRLRAALGPEATVIGVGGITTPADITAYLEAGANAVQAYTAFIYEGPFWPARVQRGAARLS
ncbi:MAG: quinone-dependent dihydroorotate dehydrogenase [Bifidobacteriaceae bacterium]|jgi:dihydroorotate dehydrogenase|nr:quinone-dependent dihydroorotate dehydrogenase [Bifidobacteriaceae bacterium]